ncbi:MAG: DUF4215 domain-containing protein [Myxococcota bacterium]
MAPTVRTDRCFLSLAWLAGLVLASACGDPSPAIDDDVTSDAAQDLTILLDFGGLPDLGGTDVDVLPPEDVSAQDADAADGSDAVLPPWTCDAEGGPGCACETGDDCNSGYCIDTPADGRICGQPCTSSCPAGYVCIPNSGSDLVYLCLPQWPVLCNPCDSDADCAAVGAAKALCVDRGPLGRFCGAACDKDADCPGDHSCQSIVSANGKQANQCVPRPTEQGVPTDCSCSPAAIASQLGTTCSADVEGGGNHCVGVRQCGEKGLSACSAIVALEVCNGQDDDCDGDTDEFACDDGNPCTTDACDAALLTCGHTATAGGCDADGNACTEGDSCADGKCVPGGGKTCNDGNPCTLDACDPAQGCTAKADDGLGCDDGDLCTVGDVCHQAQCDAGIPKNCTTGSACQTPACNPSTGQCLLDPKADGIACDDGSACTQADACKAGKCAGEAVDCNDGAACTLDTCDPTKGCQHTASTAACDDGNACTDQDTCLEGACQGKAKPVSTCDDVNPCTSDGCDPKTGCTHSANQAVCDDGNPCTAGDTCKDKSCVPGSNTCQCQQDMDCKDDGNLCNGTFYCDKSSAPFQCKVNPASVVTCNTAGDGPCAATTCNTLSGKCGPVPAADGKACDADGSVCTANDACKSGVCVAGAAQTCNDGNPCTNDACNAKTGCQNVANSAACDADSNGCTTPDNCKAGVCVAGSAKVCDDGKFCTVDSCVAATGTCVFAGGAQQGQACDADGSVCTVDDSCDGGVCQAGGALACDDGNACTIDACHPIMGCQPANAADQTSCGVGMWCATGVCVKAPSCGDTVVDKPAEQCDDGNHIDGDGCSATCQSEVAVKPVAGELVITEIMYAPNVSQANEWAEVRNITSKPLLLEGLYFGDGDGNSVKLAKPGFVVQPGAVVIIAASATPGGAGGATADYAYGYNPNGGVQFGNNGDSVCLGTAATGICTTKAIAAVTYGVSGAWPKTTTGSSLSLDPGKTTNVESKVGGNWCLGTVPFGANKDLGTPGSANPACL